MKKLFIFLIGIFLSITSFGQLKQVEVPDTTARDTVYVEQPINYNYNYYDTDGMWYNYSPYHYSWYTPYYYDDWYTPYSWYVPYSFNWYVYTPYYYTPYYRYTPYYHHNYNHYYHNYNYNHYYGHRNVNSGYKPVNRNNHNSYQYKKPLEYKPLYDHSQRRSAVPKYNESRPTHKYDNGTRVRQHIDMNPDNTRYRTPQPTYKPNRPADNPRPTMDRPQQRSYSPQPSSRPAPTRTYSAPQRSSLSQPSRPAPSNPAPSRMPNNGGRR